MVNESGKTISDADRRLLRKILGEGGKTISDNDRQRASRIFNKRAPRKKSSAVKRSRGGTAKKK